MIKNKLLSYIPVAAIAVVGALVGLGFIEPSPALAFAGLFSFGGSKSRSSSQSQSTQEGFGLSTSFSDSLSQSLSQGTSYAQGTSGSQGTSFSSGLSTSQGASTQSIAFEELFRQLFGGATNAAAKAAQLVPALTGQAASLFDAGGQFLQQLQGGTGTDYLANRLTSPSSVVNEQIGLLGEDIGAFLRNEINPTLVSNAIKAGGLGGGRQGVAQGIASQAALQQFQRGAAGIRAQDQAQRDAIAGQLAGLQQQGAATGLGALGGLYDLATAGVGAELAPYQMLAQILGGPTVLTQSQQSSYGTQTGQSQQSSFAQNTAESQQTAVSVARAIAESLGLSYDYGQSTSSSNSKSGSFSLGFGGSG